MTTKVETPSKSVGVFKIFTQKSTYTFSCKIKQKDFEALNTVILGEKPVIKIEGAKMEMVTWEGCVSFKLESNKNKPSAPNDLNGEIGKGEFNFYLPNMECKIEAKFNIGLIAVDGELISIYFK